MTEQPEKQDKTEPVFRKPSKYDPVPLDPIDRSAPGEHKVIRKENRKRVFGQSEIAKGLDFDPFET